MASPRATSRGSAVTRANARRARFPQPQLGPPKWTFSECDVCGTRGLFDGKNWISVSDRVLQELKRLTAISSYPLYRDDLMRVEATLLGNAAKRARPTESDGT